MPYKNPKDPRRAAAAKRYYEKNKNYYIEQAAKAKREALDLMRTMKEGPCEDCQLSFDPVCMDFHHPEADKEGNVSSMVGKVGRRKLLDEIAKCVLLCSNCHRLRHKGVATAS